MFASSLQTLKTVVLVTGGRDYRNKRKLWTFLDNLLRERNIVRLVAGECPTGTDLFAKLWALKRGIPYTGYPADWANLDVRPCVLKYREDGTPYNAAAGHIRNKHMLQASNANLVVATRGNSGTADMIKCAQTAHVVVQRVDYAR